MVHPAIYLFFQVVVGGFIARSPMIDRHFSEFFSFLTRKNGYIRGLSSIKGKCRSCVDSQIEIASVPSQHTCTAYVSFLCCCNHNHFLNF